jgi:transcriptional regulator with XRE-family HTH domain
VSVRQRLKKYLKFKKVSQRSFGEKINVSSGYVSSIRESILPDKLKSIALHFPDLNISWLLFGEGDMLKTAHTTTAAEKQPDYGECNCDCCRKHRAVIDVLRDQLREKDDMIAKLNRELGRSQPEKNNHVA